MFGGTFQVVAYACLGWHRHVPHPKTMQNHFIGQVKTTIGDYAWTMVRTKTYLLISQKYLSFVNNAMSLIKDQLIGCE